MTGCSHVSEGCDHCYAETIANKFRGVAFPNGFEPTYKPGKLRDPARWREPRRIFVNSMSDVHHPDFTVEQIDSVYDAMRETDRHDYLVLTKRPQRMAAYVLDWLKRRGLERVPPQVWLGTTIESNRFVWRANHLRRIPVDVRFLSCEPLLGPLPDLDLAGIGWVIAGGESGPGWRDMDLDWARDLRDRCLDEDIAYFFKQSAAPRTESGIELDAALWEEFPRPHPSAGHRPPFTPANPC